MQVVIFGGVAYNFLAQCSLQLIWSLLNTLQLILHLPLISIVHPSNALTFYIMLMGVANFDIIDLEKLQEWIFEEEVVKEDPLTLNFELLGYDGMNLVFNIGNIFFL